MSIYNNYSGSIKITIRLDHISHCKKASSKSWSNGWTYRVFIINTRRDKIRHRGEKSATSEWFSDRGFEFLRSGISKISEHRGGHSGAALSLSFALALSLFCSRSISLLPSLSLSFAVSLFFLRCLSFSFPLSSSLFRSLPLPSLSLSISLYSSLPRPRCFSLFRSLSLSFSLSLCRSLSLLRSLSLSLA